MANDVRYLEDLTAVEITADDIPFVSIQNTLLSLVLTRMRYDNANNGEAVRVVVGRLTLPLPVAEMIAANLQKYLADHRASLDAPQPEPATVN
jgi:hypothetical protein